MKKALTIFTIIFLLAFIVIYPRVVKGWFGAGMTPGWPTTTSGLNGQIALPEYKFSPDFYNLGNTVSINVRGINNTSSDVTSHYFLAVSKVTQSPKGTDISDGTPTIPGINENDLNTNHQANNDVQVPVTVIDLGNQTFPANGDHTFNGSYLTTEVGYFQFDFMDINPDLGYQPGHILAAGFFRVLTPSETTSPTPTATPTATPVATPTATPDNSGNNNNSGGSGGGSVGAPQCTATKPNAPQVLSAVKTSPTTVKLTWTAVAGATYYTISYGTSPNNLQFGVPNTGNATDFVIGALNPNSNYYFSVKAVNDCNPSDPSAIILGGGGVLGASTGGQVLGASTSVLAATNSDFETLRAIAGIAIFGLVFASGVQFLHGRQEN